MMHRLGKVPAAWEQPPAPKFAQPLLLLPELFTTSSHLSLLTGYLASIGWEVFALDLYSAVERGREHFADLLTLATEAVVALGRKVVVLGHGLGGLLALAMSGQPAVAACVAVAPAIPGFRSPIIGGLRNRVVAMAAGGPLRPPSGRTLFELVADAAPFQREALIKGLTDASATALREVARGSIELTRNAASPRLIIVGDSDIFAPHDRAVQFAETIGAQLATLPGRGHWLIGGRALERVVGEVQRFLVKALGRELLLLYPEDPA